MLYSLNKHERLKRRKVIEKLFQSGKTLQVAPILAYYSIEQLETKYPAQAGFTVSSRNFKKSVDRNRIKRLMREAYRLQKHILYDGLREKSQQLAVFLVFTGRNIPEFELVKDRMEVVLGRLVEKVREM